MSADLRQAAADAIDAPGTSEGLWAAWDALHRLPTAALPGGPVVAVAAHPDDEVLGFGGTLARLAAAGTEVHVMTITDGELSHPHSTVVTPQQLARTRSSELRSALAVLGLPDVRPVRLGVPDTQVDRHEAAVAGRLAALLRETGAAWCAAPWSGDLHSDHEAAGRAARRVCRQAGVRLWMYPVWMWHWARPGDPRVPWGDAALLRLPADVAALKAAAIGQFVSQLHPLGEGAHNAAILPPEEVAHHARRFEVVFR
ncbi:PIG-L family deacetylase [Streptomyces sp. NPDC020742]|uniref:PIG-L deacetylase family protein n=1 Tax=Streptomyces sp. NPDC020742 TaxID=3154897 RepID=UPI0033CB3422